jgi:peptidyl-prolyl cis-trans isomerase D
MLTTIREKTQGWIASVILGLLVIPFALWGVNSYFESDARIIVARVGDHEIGVETYKNALEQQRQSLRSTFGSGLNQKLFESREFKMRILDDLVDQVLLARDAEEKGYVIGDAELAGRITRIPSFQRDGKFDTKLYESVLRANGLTPRGFETRIRQEATIKQVEDSFNQSVMVTASDIAAVVRLETQARQASYLLVRPPQYLARVSVTPAAVEEYYQSNTEQFRKPEAVRIQYVRLAMADLVSKISVSEDDVQKAYAQDSARFSTAETRRASHILIKAAPGDEAADKQALQTIQALRNKLAAGEDFSKQARQTSADTISAAKGGDLGYVARDGSMVKEFEDALFGLKKGELSQPVRTSYGYHLIRVTDIKAGTRKSLREVRAELETALRTRKAEEQFYELSERFHNLVYEQSDSLKPAAEALGLALEQSDWFTREGGGGIAADRRIVEAAFEQEVLAQGRNSNPVETGPNTLLALRVLEHKDPVTLPLSDVRAQIEGVLKQRLAASEAQKVSDKLVADLQKGGSMAELAGQSGLTVTNARPATRRQPQGMDPRLLDAIFRAPRPDSGKPVYGAVEVGDGYAVYALQSVTEGNPDQADADTRAEARRLITERRGRDYYANYRKGLRTETKLRIYDDRL